MDTLLATTFIKPHSSPDVKLRHKNEPVIMQNAIHECKVHSSIYAIDFSCTLGLLCNLGKEYLHASPDFLSVVFRGGRKVVAFAVTKCRTQVHKANLDRQLSVGEDKWVEVEAGSQQFKNYVRNIKERCQLIHQAATLQMEKGVLIVGESKGSIIRALIRSYMKSLKKIYNTRCSTLHWHENKTKNRRG